jgi:hypothetical protein
MKHFLSITALLLAALVLGVGLAACGGDDEAGTTTTTATETETEQTETEQTETTTETETEPPKPAPTIVRVTVQDGVPKGGVVRASVDKGDRVVLVVSSDVADEVHVHGYDISRDVRAGGRARIAFRATIPGRFEVELEERHTPIAELTVNA